MSSSEQVSTTNKSFNDVDTKSLPFVASHNFSLDSNFSILFFQWFWLLLMYGLNPHRNIKFKKTIRKFYLILY